MRACAALLLFSDWVAWYGIGFELQTNQLDKARNHQKKHAHADAVAAASSSPHPNPAAAVGTGLITGVGKTDVR